MKLLKRKSTKPNIFWHFIDSDDFLRTSTLPLIYIDIFYSKHKRYNTRRSSDITQFNVFNYCFKEFTIRLGSSLFGKKILDVSIVNNQHEYLKYLHQEWYGPKSFIKGALLR